MRSQFSGQFRPALNFRVWVQLQSSFRQAWPLREILGTDSKRISLRVLLNQTGNPSPWLKSEAAKKRSSPKLGLFSKFKV